MIEKNDDDTRAADESMVHEVMYLNERSVKPSTFEADIDTNNLWYLDNRASNHMCGNQIFFSNIDEAIMGKVRFGDDFCVDIRGK